MLEYSDILTVNTFLCVFYDSLHSDMFLLDIHNKIELDLVYYFVLTLLFVIFYYTFFMELLKYLFFNFFFYSGRDKNGCVSCCHSCQCIETGSQATD